MTSSSDVHPVTLITFAAVSGNSFRPGMCLTPELALGRWLGLALEGSD